jgi:hypothetical protein
MARHLGLWTHHRCPHPNARSLTAIEHSIAGFTNTIRNRNC